MGEGIFSKAEKLRGRWHVVFANRTVLTAIYAALSVAGALLSKEAQLSSGFSPWYPPAGLAFAYLVVVGPRGFFAVFTVRLIDIAFTFPQAFTDDRGWVFVEAFLIAGTYTAGAHTLRRRGLEHFELREFGWFTVIAIALTPIAATVMVSFVQIAKGQTYENLRQIFGSFWIGDAVAIAAITPMVLVANHRAMDHVPTPLQISRVARGAAALRASAVIVLPILAVSTDSGIGALLLASLLPLLWVARIGDPLLASAGVFALNTLVSLLATRQLGPSTSLVDLQAVLLAASLAALYTVASSRTDARSFAEQLRQQQRRAETDRNESLGRMATGVAHDLRNYMTVASGSTQLLAKHANEQDRQLLAAIQRAADSTSQLAQRLLDFAHGRRIERRVTDVGLVITDIRPLLQALAGPYRVQLLFEVEHGVFSVISRSELEQVVVNLVTNALQACEPHGSVNIELRSTVLTKPLFGLPEGKYARLRVTDNGCGITQEQREHLFDIFYTTKGPQGTGIGLVTIAAITRESHGALHVISESGAGSTFEIYLPQQSMDITVTNEPSIVGSF
jgi:signal transduction histidine kinase